MLGSGPAEHQSIALETFTLRLGRLAPHALDGYIYKSFARRPTSAFPSHPCHCLSLNISNMRSFLIAASAALTLALPAPLPQGLDLDLISAVPTPANITVPSDATSQNVTYDSASAAADVKDAVLSSDPSIDLSESTSNSTSSTLTKRSACAAQPLGSGPVPSPDTAAAFLAYSSFASKASAAPVPSGYTQAFKNQHASNNASHQQLPTPSNIANVTLQHLLLLLPPRPTTGRGFYHHQPHQPCSQQAFNGLGALATIFLDVRVHSPHP